MNQNDQKRKNLEFLKNRFGEYYRDNKFSIPDRFPKREFAFVFFGGKGMLRHLSFQKKQEYIDFLQDRNPAHAYYSTAYYQTPDAPTMKEKNWMGAELIFDLDSDHLPGVENITYEKSLEKVKDEFYKLVDDFLIKDFGFDEKKLELYFSGGRGYHCHVKDPMVYDLDSNERREIVDYITGRDIRDDMIFYEHTTGVKRYGNKVYPSGKSLEMPKPDEPGWKGRISQAIIDIINEIRESDKPVEKLMEYGVKEENAQKLIKDLSEERIKRIERGRIDQSKAIRKFFLNNALRRTAVSMVSGETDEPVTCDVKRLIRLPDSLHGKTGFKVTKIKLDELDDFDPLTETLVFTDEKVEVELKQDYKIILKNQKYDLQKGKQKIPVFLAVFLLGRKIADIKE